MYNRCYRWVNRQVIQQKAQRMLESAQPDTTAINTTEDAIGFLETVKLIQQAIQQLPPQARKIHLMNREQGLKLSEIADELGISLQSVKNSLYRSGNMIRQYLADQGLELPLILFIWMFQ